MQSDTAFMCRLRLLSRVQALDQDQRRAPLGWVGSVVIRAPPYAAETELRGTDCRNRVRGPTPRGTGGNLFPREEPRLDVYHLLRRWTESCTAPTHSAVVGLE